MKKTLRILLTDECNLSCVYCCHEGTISNFSILTNRNLVNFIRAAHDVLKIEKVKFTGGEPLEYEGSISNIINQVSRQDVKYSLVTNATSYSNFMNIMESDNRPEITISLPIPPKEKYCSTYKSITAAYDERKAFDSINSCIGYMLASNIPFKINYVLCNGLNTSSTYIKEMIEFAQRNTLIQLRFLETAVNSTNNQNGRMSEYIFKQKEFESVLDELGYHVSVGKKTNDTRSSCLYNVDGCEIKLIKFFCDNSCEKCPEGKTSLWLTSTGYIKKCSYRNVAIAIDDWRYEKLTKQLERFII